LKAQEKKGFNADKSRCTLNTQMVQRGWQAVDNAFDLRARLADIEQQAELQAVSICVHRRASSRICV
jgi:hypothetical protein